MNTEHMTLDQVMISAAEVVIETLGMDAAPEDLAEEVIYEHGHFFLSNGWTEQQTDNFIADKMLEKYEIELLVQHLLEDTDFDDTKENAISTLIAFGSHILS